MTLTAALLVCLAATAVAQLSPEVAEWGKGPYQFLMTKEEAAAWRNIQNDADAKAFVALFWARRDPTPTTPANEYRSEIEGWIKYADANFTSEKIRGSLTDRGRTIVLYGRPKLQRKVDPGGVAAEQGIVRPQDEVQASMLEWLYEGDVAKAIFGSSHAEVRFMDRNGTQRFIYERTRIDLTKAQQRAIERSIKQPGLTAAPVFGAAAAPVPVEEVPAAPVVLKALTTDALKSAVAEVKAAAKNPYDGKAFLKWGEYVTTEGEYFVPVELYVPKASGISGELTFFGVVENAAGEGVLAFEEPATLAMVKDDFYVDRSLALPAGKHRGFFGLAQNGKVVALTSADMELAGALDKDAPGISQLILARDIFPLPVAQKPNDPFAFGGLKVVPRADRTYRTTDELIYFAELRNPGVGEPPQPTDGTVPLSPAASAPRLQVKVDVETTDKTGRKIHKSAPLVEVPAMELKGVPGRYAIGTGIPLETFQPGQYTFTIKVIDTIKKTSYTLSENFTVVQ
jgi:GWxTD domain-containing protein